MRRSIRSTLSLVVLVASVGVPVVSASAHDADPAVAISGDPPSNLGFEDAPLDDGHPPGWTVSSEADRVSVITTRDTFPVGKGSMEVRPRTGTRMLRLGAPRTENEAQTRGANTVRQTFVPQASELVVALRIVSWEFRATDSFRLDVTSGGATVPGVTIASSPTGSKAACSALPCVLTISHQKSKLLDTGWTDLTLRGLPTTSPVTLSYSLVGGDNNSHASWAYLDDVNRPPVARFDVNDLAGATRYEGSPVQLIDASYDPDPQDQIVERVWSVDLDGNGSFDATSRATSPSFIPPDEGTYAVRLVATSSDGRSDTILGGQTADDGTAVPGVVVANAPPVVNAVDVEVLAGEPPPIRAGFLDAGWTDDPGVKVKATGPWRTCVLDGTSADPCAYRWTGVPALGTGTVSGSLPANASSATVEVTDGDGGTGTDTFAIEAVAADPLRGENADDAILGAPVRDGDVSLLSWLQEPGDIDVVEVMVPGTGPNGEPLAAQPLLPGSEVLVDLSSLPADYDLALVTVSPSTRTAAYQLSPYQLSPYQLSPYQLSPYQLSAYQLSPYQLSPYQLSPYQLSPYQLSAYQLSPYQLSPYQLSPYQLSAYQLSPLSSGGYTGLDLDTTGGADLDLGELGLAELLDAAAAPGTTVQIGGFSANRGLLDETTLVRVEQAGTRVYAVVFGANGSFSDTDPYRLTLQTSVPLNALAGEIEDVRTAFGTQDVCDPVSPQIAYPTDDAVSGTGATTLFVTQRERLERTHGVDEVADLWADLSQFADAHAGRILSVGGPAFDAWDDDPCSVDAANSVADHVWERIDSVFGAGGYEYLVIVGGDDVIPFRRAQLETSIGDERAYAEGSLLRPGTPLFSALQAGVTLTDDFYADRDPTFVQGRESYTPDVALGRLVETPAQIAAQLEAFADANGLLDVSTAMVSGHDFFQDGAAELASIVASDSTLLGDGWSADDLRCALLGVGDTTCGVPDLASPNAHYTHYAALSARGYTGSGTADGKPDLFDVVTSADVATAAAAPRLVFTIGCHAGFAVPDGSGLDLPLNVGVDPDLDLAQAYAQQRSVFVANTGWGYGDDAGIAGTEDLLIRFANRLMVDGVAAGEALRAAKVEFAASQSTYDVHADKSSIQLTMYGLPMYAVGGAPAGPVPVAAAALSSTATSDLTVTGVAGITTPIALDRVDLDGSSHWTADGDVQVTAGRPWQPRVVTPVGGTTRSVLITGGSYADTTGVTPRITRPTFEWEIDPDGDVDSCLPSWWPSELTTLNDLPDGGRSLVLTPGQFRCTDEDGTVGTQRLYGALDLELLTSSAADRLPPVVSDYDLAMGAGATVDLRVHATDDSGIGRIVVLRLSGGSIHAVDVVGPAGTANTYTIPGIAYADGDEFLVQVVDGAGNVTTVTGKGANLSVVAVEADIEAHPTDPALVVFTGTIHGWSGLRPDVTYLWDFGDGHRASGVVSGSPVADVLTFEVTHPYAHGSWVERTATLRIMDTDGTTGTASVSICDPWYDVSVAGGDLDRCGARVEGGALVLRMGVRGAIDPGAQYRVEVDLDGVPGGQSVQLKYAGGSLTGPVPFTVDVDGARRLLDFRVPIATLSSSLMSGSRIGWDVSVQSGVPGSAGEGQLDMMPDTGLRPFTIP